jgi:hypothetical protein
MIHCDGDVARVAHERRAPLLGTVRYLGFVDVAADDLVPESARISRPSRRSRRGEDTDHDGTTPDLRAGPGQVTGRLQDGERAGGGCHSGPPQPAVRPPASAERGHHRGGDEHSGHEGPGERAGQVHGEQVAERARGRRRAARRAPRSPARRRQRPAGRRPVAQRDALGRTGSTPLSIDSRKPRCASHASPGDSDHVTPELRGKRLGHDGGPPSEAAASQVRSQPR